MTYLKQANFNNSLKAISLSFAPHSVLFPFYHAVSYSYCPHLANLYQIHSPLRFEKDIEELLHFMAPVSLEDALLKFNNKTGTNPSFHLSFDDGLRQAKEIIAPILIRKGIPATFFITPGFTDNAMIFHRHKVSLIIEKLKITHSIAVLSKLGSILNIRANNRTLLMKAVLKINSQTQNLLNTIAEILNIDFEEFLKREKPYLNATEINELKSQGFSIGLHSLNHPEFHLLNEIEIVTQVTESQNRLYELTGIKSNLFSFPFTDSGIPDCIIKSIITDYKMVTFGTAGIKNETIQNHFQRIPMDSKYSASAMSLISNEILKYHLKFLFGRQRVIR